LILTEREVKESASGFGSGSRNRVLAFVTATSIGLAVFSSPSIGASPPAVRNGQASAAPSSSRSDLRNEPLEIRFRIHPREATQPIVLRMTWTPAAQRAAAIQTRLYDSRQPSKVHGGTQVVPLLRKEILGFARIFSTWPKVLPKPGVGCRERADFLIVQGSEKREWTLCIDPEIDEPRSIRLRGWINFLEMALKSGKADEGAIWPTN